MADKFFPIITDTACKLKWAWSTIRLYTGKTGSCHRVQSTLVDINSTIFDFHNTPKQLADRQLMLEGKWPTGGCEYCKNIEDVGGTSDRMMHLKIPNQVPVELDTDINAVRVSPTIVEVYLDNVCNMSCLYCCDGFSSKIQQENIQFGEFSHSGVEIKNIAVVNPDHTTLKTKFWEWLDLNCSTLERLNILGGEPFYQKDFAVCIDFLDNRSNPNLEFNVVSNLNIKHDKFKNIILEIKKLVDAKKIKRFDITASVDCFGKEQEYVRYGLDLELWKKNFEFLVNEKWIVLNVNQTITGLTIKTMLPLIDYINLHRENRDIGHYFGAVVHTHKCLEPGIFGKDFFKEEFDNILAAMKTDTVWNQMQQSYMQGIYTQLNSVERDQEKINQLEIFLNEIDRRRGLDWKQTFPWLMKEIKNVA
jgi:organic radical activating enzyme